MKMKMFFCLLSLVSYLQAQPCRLDFAKSIEPLQTIRFEPKKMKLNYQSYAFSSAHKIEFIYEGKPLLAFSNKETSTLTIPVIYSPSEFSNQRQAFENAYKNLTFKLWVFEKSQKSIRMDLGKLRTLSVAPGTCAVNISNLEDIITDSPADTPATIEQKVLPTAPPVLPAHPSVPPTRSAHHEKSPSLIQYSNTEPTR